MKKLKLMGAQTLTREQQRSINGGSGNGDGCAVFFNYEGAPGGWSACTYTVAQAQALYATNGEPLYGGHGTTYYVTGYCCASCTHCN